MKVHLALLSSIVCGLLLTGCGKSDGTRIRFSGNVTLDGKPIPYGEIIITPDSSKQNSGPQGRAEIVDGTFDTKGSLGVGSGPMRIRINGMSGPGGKTICEYETSIELPSTDSTKDIDIPAKDAHNANPLFDPNVPEI